MFLFDSRWFLYAFNSFSELGTRHVKRGPLQQWVQQPSLCMIEYESPQKCGSKEGKTKIHIENTG